MLARKTKGITSSLAQLGILAVALSIGCSGSSPENVEVPVPASTDGMNNELVLEINRLVAELTSDEPDDESYFQLGRIYQANDLVDLSVETYQLYLRNKTDEPKAWYYLALAYMELGDVENASTCFRKAQSFAPEYAPIYWRLALALLDQSDPKQEALGLCETAIRLAPNDEHAHCVKARVLLEAGKPEEALLVLTSRAWKEAGLIGYASNLVSNARRMGGDTTVSSTLNNVSPIKPAWTDPWQQELLEHELGTSNQRVKADQFYRQGKIDEAMRLFLELTRSPDATGRDWSMLGACYYSKRKPNEAIKTMRLGLAKFPDDHLALLNLARVYLSLGQKGAAEFLDEAWQIAEQHSELLPDGWESLDLKGQICQIRNELEQALAWYRQACDRTSSAEQCHWRQILLLLEMRRIEDVAVAIDGIPTVSQDSPYFRYATAELARQRGDWKLATETLREIALGTVTDPVLARKLKDLSTDLKYGS